MPIPQFYTPPIPDRPSAGQGFLQAFMKGIEERRAREAQAAEMEERKERLKHLKHLIKTAEMEEKQKELYGRPFDTFESLQKIVEKGGGPRVPTGGPVTSPADLGVPSFATSLTGEPSTAPPLTMPATAPIPQSVETRFPGIPFGDQGAELQVPTRAESLEQQLAALAAEARAKRVPPTMLPTPPGAAGALGPEVPENALPGILAALTPRAPQPPEPPLTLSGDIPGVGKAGESMSPEELRARSGAYGERAASGRAKMAADAATQRVTDRYNLPRDLPEGTRNTIAGFLDVQDQLADVKSIAAKTLPSGPIGGRIAKISIEKLGGAGSNPEEIELATSLANLDIPVLVAAAGKVIPAAEMQFFTRNLPTLKDTAPNFLAKLRQLETVYQRKVYNRVRILSPRQRASLPPELQAVASFEPGTAPPYDPAANAGKTARGPDGTLWISDGKTWKRK